MLVPYQLPQFGILIILQTMCKKRGEKKEKEKTTGKAFPTSLSLCNKEIVIMISLNNHVPRLLRFWSTN
jgi:hypothetical protein